MFVSLTCSEYNIDGAVMIDALESSDLGTTTRRVNRVATLDGAAAVNDFGHSYSDKTIVLRWQPRTEAQESVIAGLVRSQSRLNVATREGVFEAAPETYEYGAAESRLTLLVLSKLSE